MTAELAEVILGERRSDRRYRVELGLRYSAGGYGYGQLGCGKTCDMSRGGVLFEADCPLLPGRAMELVSCPV
jgi:hypothetical protein